MLEVAGFEFYFLAAFTIVSACAVVIVANPLYSALSLTMTMLGISGIYYTLDAPFMAAAQLIIYAGAITVLFVMVIMLFNLKDETNAFSRGTLSFFLKMASAGYLLGLLLAMVSWAYQSGPASSSNKVAVGDGMMATKQIAAHLFSKYLVSFELVGVLLLVVLIGAIALARSRGGTHA